MDMVREMDGMVWEGLVWVVGWKRSVVGVLGGGGMD